MIRLVSQYTNMVLRKVGDDPNRPKVIILAPTGIAASLIGIYDIIMHSELVLKKLSL